MKTAKLTQGGCPDQPHGVVQRAEFGLAGLANPSLFPCVVYLADRTFRVVDITSNTRELLGIESGNLLGKSWFGNDRVVFPDRPLVQFQLDRLQTAQSAWLLHRLIDDAGSVVTVGHSIRPRTAGDREYFHGCLLPMSGEAGSVTTIDLEVVAKFIHKIGNHFQLLNLMFDSVRRNGASQKNLDALQQTTDTAIGLTHGFANLVQNSLSLSTIDLAELVDSSIGAKQFLAHQNRVSVDFRGGEWSASVSGDAMFLDLAIAAVIENAIEASPEGAKVTVELPAPTETLAKFGQPVAAVRVIDQGPGIAAEQLPRVTEPFYSTRPGRDGMGLTMAARFLEMHGGWIQVSSVDGAGTEVVIVLPIAKSGAANGAERIE